MTRFLPLLIVLGLTASPGLAGGFVFDLPDLDFPQPQGSVTPSSSGTAAPVAGPQQD